MDDEYLNCTDIIGYYPFSVVVITTKDESVFYILTTDHWQWTMDISNIYVL